MTVHNEDKSNYTYTRPAPEPCFMFILQRLYFTITIRARSQCAGQQQATGVVYIPDDSEAKNLYCQNCYVDKLGNFLMTMMMISIQLR
jgi:hypothetical protein